MEYKGRLVLPNKRNELSKTPMKSGHLRIQSKKYRWNSIRKIFNKYKKLFGNPDVKLVIKHEWIRITDEDIGDNVGMSNGFYKLVTVAPETLDGSEIQEVLVHELAHIIFPNKPHWWIECFSSKVARTRDGFMYYSSIYGHTKAELPSRNELIEMAQTKVGR